MKIVSRVARFVHSRGLEVVLVLSLISLIGQLAWPSAVYWWRLPRPGTVGFDRFDSNSLAEEFVVYLPESYRKRELWPLVVFLHGAGDRGNDPSMVDDCGTLYRRLPAIVVIPQCLPSIVWKADAVAALIQHVASSYRVDRKRIYLLGCSMGGYGTWRTADAHPELFAAIVPICGGGSSEQATSLVAIPTWAFHGEKDSVVPVTESERMIAAIRKVGGHPKLTIIPSAGHGICASVCDRADLWEWLFKQRRW